MDHFQIATANKSQETQFDNMSLSAVNALSLARDLPWETSYRLLLKQAQRYGLLLTDRFCVKNMLTEAGYVRIRGFRRLKSYSALNEVLLARYPGVTHALAMTCRGCMMSIRFCAVRRLPDPEAGFTVMDLKEENRDVFGLWLHHEEIGVPKPIPDKPVLHTGMEKPSHKGYLYYQPNPTGNNIGDCVIRAYSAVFDQSWEKTVEMLAQSCEYKDTTLNSRFVYQSLASRYELDNHSRLMEEGKGLTGVEFCDRMTLRCRNGERFFAHVGNHHVVGIIPTVINGVKQYAVADSWDSSERKIGRYWVFRPKKNLQKDASSAARNLLSGLVVGESLVHPVFGKGTIREILNEEQRVLLSFPAIGDKWMTVPWVLANCTEDPGNG